jgi:hypothetical protein
VDARDDDKERQCWLHDAYHNTISQNCPCD